MQQQQNSQQTSGRTNCRNNKPPTLSQQCNSNKIFPCFGVPSPTDIRSRGTVVRRIAANKKPLILSQQHCDFPNIGVLGGTTPDLSIICAKQKIASATLVGGSSGGGVGDKT
eukprot:scaffold5679_cov63-Cyclotella_meneghiniana.AAC.1